jgi:signal peptidase
MEPAFSRGDVLLLSNPRHKLYRTGDITVYKIPGADIPIVHRVLETHDVLPPVNSSECLSSLPKQRHTPSRETKQLLLTKGDNNPVDDTDLYNGLDWLQRKHIVGKVWG